MDDLGFNKIAGAVLATALGMLVLMKLPSFVMDNSGEEIAYKVGAIDVPGVMNGKGVKDGYAFSTALAIPGELWTYESLDKFLEKPSAYAPGTKMNFVGLKKPEDRAAVIEYLRVADFLCVHLRYVWLF